MELQVYKLIAQSKLYQKTFDIRATSLEDASQKAKLKFSNAYKVYGDDIKISLHSSDLRNHIDEILEKLHLAKS